MPTPRRTGVVCPQNYDGSKPTAPFYRVWADNAQLHINISQLTTTTLTHSARQASTWRDFVLYNYVIVSQMMLSLTQRPPQLPQSPPVASFCCQGRNLYPMTRQHPMSFQDYVGSGPP